MLLRVTLLLLAGALMGPRCGDPLDAVLLIPPQPTDEAVDLVLADEVVPHPTVDGAVEVVVGHTWRELGPVTTVQCIRVNRLIAQRSGYLCRRADGACIQVSTGETTLTCPGG